MSWQARRAYKHWWVEREVDREFPYTPMVFRPGESQDDRMGRIYRVHAGLVKELEGHDWDERAVGELVGLFRRSREQFFRGESEVARLANAIMFGIRLRVITPANVHAMAKAFEATQPETQLTDGVLFPWIAIAAVDAKLLRPASAGRLARAVAACLHAIRWVSGKERYSAYQERDMVLYDILLGIRDKVFSERVMFDILPIIEKAGRTPWHSTALSRGARLALRTGLVEPPAIVRALEPLGKVLGECRWLFTEGRWKMNLLVRLVAGSGSFRKSWRTLAQAGEEPGQPSERFLALAMKVAPRVGGFDRAFELVAQMVGRKLEPTEYLIEKLAKAG